MIILVPITTYLAGVACDEAVALVPLNLVNIREIIEDKEDGYAVINYLDGRHQKINVDFVDVLNVIAKKEGLTVLSIPKVQELSSKVSTFLNTIPMTNI